MDKIDAKIRGLIDTYIEKLEKNDIHVEQAVLFGSQFRGTSEKWSDIDIAIVSDSFEGVRIRDRAKIRRITLAVSCDLSPLPFRPEDFTSEDPLVQEILENGIRVV